MSDDLVARLRARPMRCESCGADIAIEDITTAGGHAVFFGPVPDHCGPVSVVPDPLHDEAANEIERLRAMLCPNQDCEERKGEILTLKRDVEAYRDAQAVAAGELRDIADLLGVADVSEASETVEHLAAENARLWAALDEISDGCRCTHPDSWALGQCDCQTKIARAALAAQKEES